MLTSELIDGIRCYRMRIAVCGIGYTGLALSLVLCEFGHLLSCFDVNPKLSENLQNICFVEPGLSVLIRKHEELGNLKFVSDLNIALDEADAVFITIPVKGQMDEDINLSSLIKLLEEIATCLQRDKYLPLFIKTAVPVGTTATLANNVAQIRPDLISGTHYDVINNPNFMREGSALHDLMMPDRMIFGLSQNTFQQIHCPARKIIDDIFLPLKQSNIPFLYTNYEAAELIKSATMGLITVKMAYANEIERLCNNVGIDLKTLLKGINSDRRVNGDSFIFSAGVGGSSLPRTSRLLINSAKNFGTELSILSIALESNDKRIHRISTKILQYFNDDKNISNHKIAILGIAFKSFSDDIRESPSLYVIRDLLENRVKVSVYDPYYLPQSFNIKNIPQDITSNSNFSICSSAYDCVTQSDSLVVMTDWPQFRQLDWEKVKELMSGTNSTPMLFDCSNAFRDCSPKFRYIAA